MKKILIVSSFIAKENIQSSLEKYLSVMQKFPHYRIDIVYTMNRGENNISFPSNITVQQLLTPIETEFFIYCCEQLEKNIVLKANYYSFWKNHLIGKANELFLEKINRTVYNSIIVFDMDKLSFDNFLEQYNITAKIPVIKWVHNENTCQYWTIHHNVLTKYRYVFTSLAEIKTACEDKLSELSLENIAVKQVPDITDIENSNNQATQELFNIFSDIMGIEKENKKKILIIQPHLVLGGVETVLVAYLNMIVKLGNYDIDLVFLKHETTSLINKIPSEVNIRYILTDVESQFTVLNYIKIQKNIDFNYHNSWLKGAKLKINKELLKIINHTKYDCIINFGINEVSFDDFLQDYDIDKNIPIIRWQHSGVLNWKDNEYYYRNILNKYQHIIAICDDMAEHCRNELAQLGAMATQVHRIYNPFYIEDILDKSLKPNTEDEKLLADDFILQVARLDENQKNHFQLVTIFAKLKQKGITEKLYIVGNGPDKIELEQHIQELGLEKECLLIGSRDNPYPFMKKAKLFVHTARFEGLPTVLIESMVCGTPVVAMDCPTGPREILADGKYGALVPLYDEQQFVEKTLDLLNNETKRQHYIGLLPEAVQRFSFETIGKQLSTTLTKILEKGDKE